MSPRDIRSYTSSGSSASARSWWPLPSRISSSGVTRTPKRLREVQAAAARAGAEIRQARLRGVARFDACPFDHSSGFCMLPVDHSRRRCNDLLGECEIEPDAGEWLVETGPVNLTRIRDALDFR